MNETADRPLLAAVRERLSAIGGELRELAAARWELARLEIESDLRSLVRLAIFWSLAAAALLTALPLAAAALAEALDGRLGIGRPGWLLILAAVLLVMSLSGGYCAWRRFRRRFTGLRETLEELREDLVWLKGDRK
ncbi:MAG: phage holin family protein [Pirellulales bacterium]|nr:phage holin family protein [Pirellulales bacterium]